MHPLKLSHSRRTLLKADGSPFFWLADTAWELFHRLTRDQIKFYLQTRAEQRFTVIQAVLLAELDGLRVPNREGHLPLIDLDPLRPNEQYFELVDWTIDTAAELGLTMALLPTWGDKVCDAWGTGPVVFNPGNAFAYGAYLGNFLRGKPIVWVNGGDRPIRNDGERLVWRRIAEGIRSEAGTAQLMTFHPTGRNSSGRWVHDEPWLDFNMLQSGHSGRDTDNWNMIRTDRAREPAKPVLDAEPNYEDHPVMGSDAGGQWSPVPGQWFDDYDVRKSLYRSMLSGACGYTYGCHAVWQFNQATDGPTVNFARRPWDQALRLPGAEQLRHARGLFESVPWEKLIPADTLLERVGDDPAFRSTAARTLNNSHALVYTPAAKRLDLNLPPSGPVRGTWFDPRTGERTPVAGTLVGRCQIQPPSHNDWVLVLEAAQPA